FTYIHIRAGAGGGGRPKREETADTAKCTEIRGYLPLANAHILKGCIDTLIRNTIAHGAAYVNMRWTLFRFFPAYRR
ncbi:MAG: hypothetical protein LBL45_05560, partial [Treponema sp.]|nr:hypothetical protein [Treponema sp.]